MLNIQIDYTSEAHINGIAYAEARLIGDNAEALRIARCNPSDFDWSGELPDGFDDGSDGSDSSEDYRLHLVASGRIVWDDSADKYVRA